MMSSRVSLGVNKHRSDQIATGASFIKLKSYLFLFWTSSFREFIMNCQQYRPPYFECTNTMI